MSDPRRPCWIIRVHRPLAARRMVEPPVAARSKTPVRSNLRLAACLAPLEAWIALRSTVQSAAFTVYAGTKIGHANTARNLGRQIEIGSRF
jgi:hypothetical protein